MSELTYKNGSSNTARWKLLTGVSVLALTVCGASSGAIAENASHSIVWVDLSGQLAWGSDGQETFLPPFVLTMPRPPFETTSPEEVEKQASASWDGEAKLSFQPEGSEWTISAGIRYGKSGRNQYLGQITNHKYSARYWAYQNITSQRSEKHEIVDFQVGRDVGLGLNASSKVNFGVRFAQFSSRANAFFDSRPQNFNYYVGTYTRFNATIDAKRSFSGIGPSVSWNGTAAIAGNTSDGEIDIDWGVNAALLFGRQKVRGFHNTTTVVYPSAYPAPPMHHTVSLNRGRQVAVPNLGGFAGASWRLPNAKLSFGYKADFFFGAVDGGIDAAKRVSIGFHGPFASVGIGIGG